MVKTRKNHQKLTKPIPNEIACGGKALASGGGGLGLAWNSVPWPRGAFSKSRFLPLICTTSLGATDFQKNVLGSGFLHMVHIQMSLVPKK